MLRSHSNDQRPNIALEEELYGRFTPYGRWRKRLKRLIHNLLWLLVIHPLTGAKRFVDMLVSSFLLLFLSLLLIAIFSYHHSRGHIVERLPHIGRWGEPFYVYRFRLPDSVLGRVLTRAGIHRLPVLLNIFKGEMSFVGPRPVTLDEMSLRSHVVRKRLAARPGLICLWWLRRRANIDYGDELEADREYTEVQSLSQDVGIALRALPALLYGESAVAAPELIDLLGISINNLTMTETLDAIASRLHGGQTSQICFVNADCINIAYRNPQYLQVLQQGKLTLADGIGLKLAGKLLSQPVKQNVNGTDLFPRLCDMLSGTSHGLYLLGARPGVAEGVKDWIAEHYPDVMISGWHHGYYTPEEEPEVIRRIAASGAAILLVAFGAPRQDTWVSEHLSELGVSVAMGVGGLFDFYSGRIPRAPLWMREMGIEWLYRFYQEPRRMWKRYFIGNGVFLARVMKYSYQKPLETHETISQDRV